MPACQARSAYQVFKLSFDGARLLQDTVRHLRELIFPHALPSQASGNAALFNNQSAIASGSSAVVNSASAIASGAASVQVSAVAIACGSAHSVAYVSYTPLTQPPTPYE